MPQFQKLTLHRKFGNTPIEIQVKKLQVRTLELLPYLNPQRFNSFCKEGCPNYSKKWTCPPNLPDFEQYSRSYPNVALILFYTEVTQFGTTQEHSMEAYNFTKEELQQWLRQTEAESGARMIAANSCEICKTCQIEKEKPCLFPERLRFNFAAFGFDINSIMKELLHHELQWAGKDHVPQYMSSVGALLLNEDSQPFCFSQV